MIDRGWGGEWGGGNRERMIKGHKLSVIDE